MKIKIRKFKKFLKNLPLAIAQHAFLACLLLFFSALIFGGLLFYKYSILVQKTKLEDLSWGFYLEEETYQQVLKVWQEQEQKFQEADSKEYPNPFIRLTE